jgi:hypothetical protein
VGGGVSYRAFCVDVRTWGLNVGEENVEQIGDGLMIRSGLAFRDREPFDVCRRGSPRGGLFNCLVDGSGWKAEQIEALIFDGFHVDSANCRFGESLIVDLATSPKWYPN